MDASTELDPSTIVTPAWHEGTAVTADGITLRTRHWPAVGTARALALVTHGLGEHVGRYDPVALPMAAAGIDVHGFDLRGFGGSAGQRAFVDRWSRYYDDLEERVAALREANPGLPLVLYGHSLGALISLGYVLSTPQRPAPDVLVLSALAIEDRIAPWKRVVAGVLSGILPGFRLPNGLAEDGLSRDPSVRAATKADPLCTDRSTVRFGAEGWAEQARIRERVAHLASMPMPTYVLHGADDPIFPVAASEPLERLGNVTRRVYPGLRHECHHEPEHADVLQDVVAWLDTALPDRAATGDSAASV
jgi:alpha-beta hydrolase superfamily lysophospholipase